MKNISLVEELQKEFTSEIQKIDSEFNIKNAIEMYFKVLDYDLQNERIDDLRGLRNVKYNALQKIILEKNFSNEGIALIGSFNQNFESFVKKIYYTLEDFGQIEEKDRLDSSKRYSISPYLNKLKKSIPLYEDAEGNPTTNINDAKLDAYKKPIFLIIQHSRAYKELFPKNFSFDEFENPEDLAINYKYDGTFLIHFIRAYILRNKLSHSSPDFSLMQNLNNLNSTFIAELWLIDFLMVKLKSGLLQYHGKNQDFKEYIIELGQILKPRTRKFVPLLLQPFGEGINDTQQSNIEDIIKKDVIRFRILGEGGSGKTTTLEFIANKFCEEWLIDSNTKIPVIIYLANLREQDSIKQTIAKKMSIEANALEELIKSNSIILLLDGINEIIKSSEIKRERLNEISNLLNINENLDIIITDRFEFDTFQNNPFSIETFSIQKLNENQIEQFVKNYCIQDQKSTNKILEVINSKPRIRELLLKPLLLSRAIEIIKIENDLPEKEGMIIERFIDLMLKREKNEKMDPLLNVGEFKLLMGYVADQINTKFQSNSPISEFSFRKIINSGAEFLGLEKHNAGFTLRIGYELEIITKIDDYLQFYHQSYYDFFSAYFFMNYHNV